MFEKFLRPFFQNFFVDPLARKLILWPSLHPSHLTLIGSLTGLLGSFTLGSGQRWISLGLLLISGYLDILDGTLARFKNQASPFGAALDIVCDRLVEFAIVVGLYSLYHAAYLVLFILGSILLCVTSFLIVGMFSENTSHKGFYYSPGLVERGEAFFLFGLMVCFPSFFPILAALFSFLVFLTAAIRLFQFSSAVKQTRAEP